MPYETVLRIIEVALQLIMVAIAWKALSVWKSEIRGRDRYQSSKDLLEYIKKLRFLVHAKGSFHQIYLNDILVKGKKFYKRQLSLIAKERVYFDRSFFGLFGHLNVRSDFFLPKQVRLALEELYPSSADFVSSDKSKYTYIQLSGVDLKKVKDIGDGIFIFHPHEETTVGEYFRKWETLITELQKGIYE